MHNPIGKVYLLSEMRHLFVFVTGVQASRKIAERDLGNMNRYKILIKRVGEALCIEPAVIAGIISRESHAGTILKNGWGDNGNGFGLMQVFADAPIKPNEVMPYKKKVSPNYISPITAVKCLFFFFFSF